MHKGWQLLLSAFVFLFFGLVQSTYAATTLTGSVVDSQGEDVGGIAINLYDSSSNYIDFTYAESDGTFAFENGPYTAGSYTLTFSPDLSFDCNRCGLLSETSRSITVNNSSTQNLGSFTLTVASRIVAVSVVDQNGSPATGVSVSAWGNSGSDWAYGTVDSNGQYSFGWSEDLVSISVYPDTGGYTSGYEYDVSVNSSGTTSITITIRATDAELTANLVDTNGDPFTLGDNEYAYVNCFSPDDWDLYFFGDISGGESSVTMDVVAGSYQCDTWLDGYGATSPDNAVSVSANGSASFNITVQEFDSEINFKFVDSDGNTLTEDDLGQISAYTNSTEDADGNEYWGIFSWGDDEDGDGVVTMEVLSGYTYDVGGYFYDDSEFGGASVGIVAAANGVTYMQNYNMESVVASASQAQTVTVELLASDATIEVNVKDSEGNNESFAWVSAEENIDYDTRDPEEFGWGLYVGGSTDSSGDATLNVVSGKTYRVFAYPSDVFNGNTLPPAEVLVTPEAGETVTVNMASLEADHTATVEFSYDVEGDDPTLDYSYCYAYAPRLGIETFSDFDSSTLPMLTGYQWYVGCMGFEGENFYRSIDAAYTPSGSSGTVNVTLTDAGEYFEETSYTFSATSTNTITLPDGESTLTIPANAIDSSGNVTITVSTATGYTVSDTDFPVEAFEFAALNSSGEDVEEFEANLTLTLHYDDEDLSRFGVDEESMLGASYDEDTSSWGSPVSVSVDTEENTITIVLSHFSAYGLVGNRTGVSSNSPVDSVVPKTNNRVKVNYEDGSSETFRVFSKGSGKPRAQVSSDGESIVVLKHNGTHVKAIDPWTGSKQSMKKLSNKKLKRKNTRLVVLNYYNDAKDDVLVLRKNGGNQKLFLNLLWLNGNDVLKKKAAKTHEEFTESSFSLKRKKKQIRIKSGSTIHYKYKVTRAGKLKIQE